jgi:26S proteasome regulatory subunit N8
MLEMFRKVNKKERVVGFYSTGPSIRPNDLRIHDVVQRFTTSTIASIFCIIDVRPDRPELPVTAYKVVEEVSSVSAGGGNNQTGTSRVQRTFAHLPVKMGAMEAEEVGVEHLLRDINDPTVTTLASLIKSKLSGLSTLTEKLLECHEYLQSVAADPSKANPEITANLQTILNLLPNLNQPDLVQSMIVKTNDMHMAIYLAALIRSVIALHDLINNKIQFGLPMSTDNKGSDAEKVKTKADGEEKKEDGGKTESK